MKMESNKICIIQTKYDMKENLTVYPIPRQASRFLLLSNDYS